MPTNSSVVLTGSVVSHAYHLAHWASSSLVQPPVGGWLGGKARFARRTPGNRRNSEAEGRPSTSFWRFDYVPAGAKESRLCGKFEPTRAGAGSSSVAARLVSNGPGMMSHQLVRPPAERPGNFLTVSQRLAPMGWRRVYFFAAMATPSGWSAVHRYLTASGVARQPRSDVRRTRKQRREVKAIHPVAAELLRTGDAGMIW